MEPRQTMARVARVLRLITKLAGDKIDPLVRDVLDDQADELEADTGAYKTEKASIHVGGKAK